MAWHAPFAKCGSENLHRTRLKRQVPMRTAVSNIPAPSTAWPDPFVLRKGTAAGCRARGGGGLRSFLARGSMQDARLIRIAPARRVSFGAAGRLGLARIH